MNLVDQNTNPANTQSVKLRARRDLQITESQFQGESCWILKDPIALKYFRLRAPEYRVFQMLDDRHTYQQIQCSLQTQFPEQRIDIANLQQLVGSFYKSGLLIAHSAGQATSLKKKDDVDRRRKMVQLLSSIVAIKFPGFDPDQLLSWLHPKIRWLFTPAGTVINMLIMLSAATMVLVNFDECMQRLPEFQQFFGIKNLVFMFAILIVTKSIHELGHGLMCKHFGGECHEIGFMLLVMTPAMYCNTSDSWILPNKWKRIAIGAAGMYVEVVLAALCTFIWWWTEPGVVHYLSLNIMFLSGVSTVVFNANPLLRYDGYFMLSDYLEIPNLSSKAKLALTNQLRVRCLGMKPLNDRMLPDRNQATFASYSVASFLYRWFVMFFIFWFLNEVFEPYGLQVIGQAIIAISVTGMILVPLFKLVRYFQFPGRFREVQQRPTVITAMATVLALSFLFLVEIPHSVWGHFVVRPAEAQYMYVNEPGAIKKVYVAPGDSVEAGQALVELENPELRRELAALEGKLAAYEADWSTYQMLNQRELLLDASRKASEAQTAVRELRKLIRTKRKQIESLTIRADRAGEIIPPPNVPEKDLPEMKLAAWTGTPLEPENGSAFLDRETLFCIVGDPRKKKAVLLIDQSDVQLLSPGQQVKLVVHQYRNKRLNAMLKAVSQNPIEVLPRELSKTNGGPVAGMPTPEGLEEPLLKSYEATVPLSDVDIKLQPGMFGTARVEVGRATIAYRIWRYIQTIINFR
ncbi:MAG: biotin/lipoyl-binding protein [Aureliella sp.]